MRDKYNSAETKVCNVKDIRILYRRNIGYSENILDNQSYEEHMCSIILLNVNISKRLYQNTKLSLDHDIYFCFICIFSIFCSIWYQYEKESFNTQDV